MIICIRRVSKELWSIRLLLNWKGQLCSYISFILCPVWYVGLLVCQLVVLNFNLKYSISSKILSLLILSVSIPMTLKLIKLLKLLLMFEILLAGLLLCVNSGRGQNNNLSVWNLYKSKTKFTFYNSFKFLSLAKWPCAGSKTLANPEHLKLPCLHWIFMSFMALTL